MRSRKLSLALLAFTLIVGWLPACAPVARMDPAFPISMTEAKHMLSDMRDDRKPFDRPVVVLSGIYDPGVLAPAVARKLRRVATEDVRMISVSFFLNGSFEDCRAAVIRRVNAAWPSDDPEATVEVDVVAVSMGGLVARYAARPRIDGEPRLNVRRLFTISTPHLGARLAALPTFDKRVRDMRFGSAFINLLNEQTCPTDPEIIPYVRLNDVTVGEDNAAPPGMKARWVSNPPFSFSHLSACFDARILADIAQQLRSGPTQADSPASIGGDLPSGGTAPGG